MYILGASPPALPALRPATFPTVYTLDAAPSHRAHFPARNVPSRAHFLAAPAKTARTVRTFRHKRVPTVHTNRPEVYTVGDLPFRNVSAVGVFFAVYAFRHGRVPTAYTLVAAPTCRVRFRPNGSLPRTQTTKKGARRGT